MNTIKRHIKSYVSLKTTFVMNRRMSACVFAAKCSHLVLNFLCSRDFGYTHICPSVITKKLFVIKKRRN
ncbi:hypothetical protein J6590_103111, partial [Homalodisca vitripennis]